MTSRNSTMQQGRQVHMPPKTEAELEAEAIRELEHMERALNAKKSNNGPKRWGRYEDRRG
ncbi:hypothetical protein K9F62_20890 [Desulfovibrio sp. JY]|nr:hypothetical protein K9F62_20890 [Desulfovibrio sp. JY]